MPGDIGQLTAARVTRQNQKNTVDFADNTISVPSLGDHSFLGKTVDGGSYPAVAQSIYLCVNSDVECDETEGAVATYADQTDNIPCLNIGTNVPPVGTRVICVGVGGRICFRF